MPSFPPAAKVLETADWSQSFCSCFLGLMEVAYLRVFTANSLQVRYVKNGTILLKRLLNRGWDTPAWIFPLRAISKAWMRQCIASAMPVRCMRCKWLSGRSIAIEMSPNVPQCPAPSAFAQYSERQAQEMVFQAPAVTSKCTKRLTTLTTTVYIVFWKWSPVHDKFQVLNAFADCDGDQIIIICIVLDVGLQCCKTFVKALPLALTISLSSLQDASKQLACP